MFHPTTRRSFLRETAVGGAALGLAELGFLSKLPPVRADEAQPNPKIVQMQPDIEPIVRLLEDTPREKLLEEVAARIQRGLTYREVLAALLLAGVRNIQPRPSVGYKFHAVLVVNSAHLASISSPDEHRWLPIFWALDYFKNSQADDRREGDWTMRPVDEQAVPSADKAAGAFRQAMDAWDVEAADAAVAGLARTAGANEVFETLFHYGSRDFRDIGHKAIFVANSYRTLQCVGWRYAEPVLRSLAFALLNHRGDPNPAQSESPADQPGRRNAELAKKLRGDWSQGKLDSGATRDMLVTLREGSADEACDKAVQLINGGAHPQSVWDAVFLGGGELLFRQRGIVSLHALTSANALHYAYETSQSDTMRRMALLQNAAFVTLFRDALSSRGKVRDFAIEKLEPASSEGPPKQRLEEIFADVSKDRTLAARKTLAALDGEVNATQLIDAARVLVFLKGTGSHDYKFSSAVLEDYYHVSPAWRDRFLAAGVYNLHGSGERDNALVKRARAALDA